MIDFTVAIPTFNGEQRLPDVLECLRSQIDVDGLAWEILVIDNNSSDRTREIVQRYQANFPYPLRYCLEPEQGAAFARKRAIRTASSDLIGFLDDDNLPADRWVAAAVRFAHANPNAGAIGSRINGEFEVEPPQHFKRLLPYFAIIQRGTTPSLYKRSRKILPPSAGLVIRKQAWTNCVPEQTILNGRVTGNMLTGEDTEALAHMQRSPWEIWHNPNMTITHKIPQWRFERPYLMSFFRGIGLSRYATRMASTKPQYRPLMRVVYMLNDLRKVAVHLAKYRRTIRTDLAAVCELELYLSSLISPFYLHNNGYLRRREPQLMPTTEVESL
ncbi:glycosyltransferase [Oculatella sp. LEGE 06141]|uniref:hormogonium polysaccharide biosynthesis glycosyltransferase HpsE n=1 Tax=Oculatella sp. LEGE 06141 TaxID=1828648 RepID=UPI001882D89F|nr:hormogonium polysaccharide biosynthesis glycosyltransferase HpsE [Oculatella sp. LEGE 06141]MBE9179228.1 glycosyltransferase [Oculatella sp. LEGE 06141]